MWLIEEKGRHEDTNMCSWSMSVSQTSGEERHLTGENRKGLIVPVSEKTLQRGVKEWLPGINYRQEGERGFQTKTSPCVKAQSGAWTVFSDSGKLLGMIWAFRELA